MKRFISCLALSMTLASGAASAGELQQSRQSGRPILSMPKISEGGGRFVLFTMQDKHPVMRSELACSTETLPSMLNLEVYEGKDSTTLSVDATKIKDAYLCIKYSKTVPHAFTVFTFEEGGVSGKSRALVVTMWTGRHPAGHIYRALLWRLFTYDSYMRIALKEKKDRVQFYRYKLPRHVARLMFHNALTIADKKNDAPDMFGLLDNNCIQSALEIPNSVRPEDRQLRGVIPSLAALRLQLLGLVEKPVEVRGDALLDVDFSALADFGKSSSSR